MKHTPGPWRAEENHTVWSPDNYCVAIVALQENGVQSANAQLIAAAPELLEACKTWADYFDRLEATSMPDDPMAQARQKDHAKRIAATKAAISKAEGQANG